MRRIYILFFMLFAITVTTPVTAQVKGGRKREHRNQRSRGSIFKRQRSSGHADAFAANSRKKSFFAKVFQNKKSSTPGWSYRKTKPGSRQKSEQAHLFTRQRSSGRTYKERQLSMQNKRRSRTRDRGNKSFRAIKK